MVKRSGECYVAGVAEVSAVAWVLSQILTMFGLKLATRAVLVTLKAATAARGAEEATT
jgi:hypothetical protein